MPEGVDAATSTRRDAQRRAGGLAFPRDVLLAGLPARFEPTELLGRGAQKAVYRAHDALLERDVAIAAFAAASLGEHKEQLLREARIMARVGGSRHVVSIFDVVDGRDAAFIVSEYMPGGDLTRYTSSGETLPVELAARLAAQLCAALAAAHRRGVVHLDVKPANVLLDQRGDAFLTDFGLSRLGESGTRIGGTLTGTPTYLAPEQIGSHAVDNRCDLYALGVVLYELLAGVPPHDVKSVNDLLHLKLNVDPARVRTHRPDVPSRLDELIASLLARRPADRPGDALDVRNALLDVARGRPAPTRPLDGVVRPQLPPALSVPEATPFVGRDRELARLAEVWQRTCAQRCVEAVAIAGEPGIGKTRLIHELGRRVHAEGATVLLGTSSEEPLVPYQPFAEALRHYTTSAQARDILGRHAGDLEDLVALVPEAASLLSPRAAMESDAETRRYRMFGAVRSLLGIAAEAAPVLVLLEDLHWADRSTMLLLAHLLQSDPRIPVMLVLTYRSAEIGGSHPLAAAMAEMHRHQRLLRLDVAGLDEHGVRTLLESMTGGPVPLRTASTLRARTDGNPFFVGETVRDLLDRHDDRTPFDWQTAFRDAATAIPRGVEEVIRHRTARLDGELRSLLQSAAVIGRDFDASLLAAVVGIDDGRVIDTLEPALERGILVEVPDALGRYRFTHALMRDTLHRQLSASRRARLHLAVADALVAASAADPDRFIADLAYHYGEGGDAANALSFALRAAWAAVQRLAYQEAADLYENALHALARHDDGNLALRCEILLARSDILWSGGETGTAEQVAYEAADCARRAGLPQLLARAALAAGGKLSGLHIGVLDERLLALLEESLRALPAPDDPLRARVMARLAEALTFASDSGERRVAMAREAVALARRTADLVSQAEVLRHAHWSIWGPDNPAERLAISDEMDALALASDARGLAMSGRGWRLVDLLELGRVDDFERELAAYEAEAAELRQPVFLYVAHLRRTMLALLRGRFAEAEAMSFQTLTLGELAQVGTSLQVFGAQMFSIRQEQGRLGELDDAIRGIREQFPHNAGWPIAHAFLYSQSGRESEAAAEIEALARHGFTQVPRDLTWNVSMAYLARVCFLLGDAAAARLAYALHDERVIPCVVAAGTAPLGAGARTLALLAATMRDWSAATRWFEAALEMNAALRAPSWLAHTQADYATMLARRGGMGDHERAVRLTAAARETATALGLTALQERIDASGL